MKNLSRVYSSSILFIRSKKSSVPDLGKSIFPHKKIHTTMFGAPSFTHGDVISFSASTTQKEIRPKGYRVLRKDKKITMFSEAIRHYPEKLKQMASVNQLFINAYPAFIIPTDSAAYVDTYLSLKTASKSLALAAERGFCATLLAQPLFMMEILLHHQRHLLDFPENLILVFGGYTLPTSLYDAIEHFFEDKPYVNVSYIIGYGVAEVDAGLFYAVERLGEEWLYYPRSDVNCKIVSSDPQGFGKLLVSVDGSPLVDAGDLARQAGDAYFIRSNPLKVSPSVLTLLNTWSPKDWARRTGYLAQHNNEIYFQLRKGCDAEISNELPFFLYADRFDFSWQEKPQWNYGNNLYNVFFSQFNCLDPDSPFVRNYLYPTSKGVLLAEEIIGLRNVCRKGDRLYRAIWELVSEAIANSLGNEGVSDAILSGKLDSDSLTILRNKTGKVVGILTFSCSPSEEDFMYMGLHLLDEAKSSDIMKIHHLVTMQRAMNIRNTDKILRLSKTHSAIAIHVEEKVGKVKPDLQSIKLKMDLYMRAYLEDRLKEINFKKQDVNAANILDTLNTLLLREFVNFIKPNEDFPTVITSENCDQWLTLIPSVTVNFSKLIDFGDKEFEMFSDFKLIDKNLRQIFSEEVADIKPRILSRMKSFIGDNINNREYFDSDYLIHRKADPPYNLSEVCDGPVKSVNEFLKGTLRYEEGDIFVYTNLVKREQLPALREDILKKLPEKSRQCFDDLLEIWSSDIIESGIDDLSEESCSPFKVSSMGFFNNGDRSSEQNMATVAGGEEFNLLSMTVPS